ncbi:LodA/GoxA family CTQ-dependent oxidase [Xanthobacter aminoxidans]|uniref:LodA/GoxA family CTQ-dependent oxidase n=1 Tax=Xanthobacter aminoxidans TaxID=186280 RepID=UPI00372B97E9
MAKQAVRFRLFAYDAQGRVVGKVTVREAEVSWTLTVANTKALWYGIDIPFDLPGAPAAGRCNAKVADRASHRDQPRHAPRCGGVDAGRRQPPPA